MFCINSLVRALSGVDFFPVARHMHLEHDGEHGHADHIDHASDKATALPSAICPVGPPGGPV